MPKPLVDDTITSCHLNYPVYLEKFSELYVKTKNAQPALENPALLNAAHYFALFSHALINKSFLLALNVLEEASKSIHEMLSSVDTTSPLHEPVQKLHKFTCNLQKQYEEFVEKKKLNETI